MGQDPEQLRADIAKTRQDLDADLDLLGEKVSPEKVIERRVDATKGKFTDVREKMMGPSSGSQGSGLTDAVKGGPDAAKSKAAGQPFIAGLVAFGAGWLLSSLLPASQAEIHAADKLRDNVEGPLKDQLKESANEIKENVQPAAQQAAESVKDSATGAAETVKGEAQSAQSDVKGQAAGAADNVKGSAQDAKDQAKKDAGSKS